MQSFSEYMNEKEERRLDEELLNEDPLSVVGTVLAIPAAGLVVAWGASLVANGYYKFMSGTTEKIVNIWKSMFRDLKEKITGRSVTNNVREMSRDSKVKQQMKEMNQDKQLYGPDIKGVLDAIEKQDFDEAADEFQKLDKELANNPDVHKVIINEISKELKEPPLYVSSPGNETYQAIKKIINIRVARAAAMASKLAIERNLKNDATDAAEKGKEDSDKEEAKEEIKQKEKD